MNRNQNQVYDHRLRQLVFETQDIDIALRLGVPRSTASCVSSKLRLPWFHCTYKNLRLDSSCSSVVAISVDLEGCDAMGMDVGILFESIPSR